MPSYDYHCPSCSTDTTITRPIDARVLDACPVCGDPGIVRLYSPPNIATTYQPREATLPNGDHRVEVLREDKPGMAGYHDIHPDGSKHTTLTPFAAPDTFPPNVEVRSP